MFPFLLLPFLRRFGALGAVVALARTPMGRRLTAQARTFISDPARREKFTQALQGLRSTYKTAPTTPTTPTTPTGSKGASSPLRRS